MRYILFTISLIVSGASFAQDHSAKIVEAYGQEMHTQMTSSNPGMIELLNKYVEHGIVIEPMNPKYASVDELSSIELRSKNSSSVPVDQFINDYNSSDFNPLVYNLFPSTGTQVYRLQGTNQVLIIYNQETILSK